MTSTVRAAVDRALPAAPTTPADHAFAAWLSAQHPALDAPCAIRVLGAAGSGAPEIAAALDTHPRWAVEAVDSDDPPPPTAPDIEVLCLCTAPCTHELAWLERPRRHPMLLVATRTCRFPADATPAWAANRIHLAGPPWPNSTPLAAEPGFAQLRAVLERLAEQRIQLRAAATLARLDRDCDALGFRAHAEALAVELSPLVLGSSSAGSPPQRPSV